MKTISKEVLVNEWLKFHNTTVKDILEKYPEECADGRWFKMFGVTQQQHDDWVIWAKAYIKKELNISKKHLELGWPLTYLDCSPTVIGE